MKNKVATILFALAVCFVNHNAYAQNETFLTSRVWHFNQLVPNAPSQENVYLIIMPVGSSSVDQAIEVTFHRSGVFTNERYNYIIPSGTEGRTIEVRVNDLPFFNTGQLVITTAIVHCAARCTAQVILRPNGSDFWRATYLTGIPVTTETTPIQ